VVVLDESDVERAQLINDIAQAFALGPAFAEELNAAGLGDGIWWEPNVLYFDTARVDGAAQITLGTVIVAHDPATPASPDPYIDTLVQLEADAQAIVDGNGNLTAEAKTFCAAFLTWAANDVPR
jgi:hypothetical protein